uniref:tastin isoform X1 n=1 Tax=Podarcis muralis TaxID=64176 RepID=UPI00109FEFEF|nr:tastin isoform X1 [Podarcis muralis]XP_028567878.1 tastin isoform X1 [Podarcis muralis]XP_028567887.1 tastin isoform X1 [Podarcis muralis]
MARVGKENLQEVLPLPVTSAGEGREKSASLASGALSSSKIPVLRNSRIPREVKQSRQQPQNSLHQACPSNVRRKGIEMSKMPHSGLVPDASAVEPASGLMPKILSREPLGEMHLSTSGHRNEGRVPNGKEVSTVEFVPDVAALASILSNTGLTNHMVSAAHKPSLAGRVPLRGNRACSTIVGTGRGSLYTGAPAANLPRMSYISRSTSKDVNQPQSSNTQQLKMRLATFENPGPRVEVVKPSRPTENPGVGKPQDSAPRPEAEGLNLEGAIATQRLMSTATVTECLSSLISSDSAGKKEITGTPWKDDGFVPDPAAKASILLNIGVSHSALRATADRSTRGESASLPLPCTSVRSTEKFGRVSCRSTQRLKGLQKLEASEAQLANTPGGRCSAADHTPYGLARRVPIASPQSSHRSPWIRNRAPVSSCIKAKKVNLASKITSLKDSVDSKEDDTAVAWESIAVRLFKDEIAASAKKVAAVPVITPEMGKLQRIKLLAQLLQQEVNDGIDHDIVPSLGELHKLLSDHCSPAREAPKPGLLTTPVPSPGPDLGKLAPGSAAMAPEPCTTHATTSSQQPVCPISRMPSVQLRASSGSGTSMPLLGLMSSCGNSAVDQVKQRLDDLLSAPMRFHEARLNDECAFYTTRLASVTQPSAQRCKEPVAKMLEVQDAMHFIPISATPSRPMEAERVLPS